MYTIITRLFHDRGRAASAVAELERVGFGARTITVIGPEAAGGSGDGVARVTAQLTAADVAPAAAAAYAKEAVRTNGTLVVVNAAFSRAVPAQLALDSFGPVELAVPDPYRKSADKYDPTPLSDLLGLPVLWSYRSNTTLMSGESNTKLIDEAAPFSRMFGLPTLKSGESNTKLIDEPAPFSRMFGLPTLTKKQ